MATKRHSLLGRAVWTVGTRVAKRKARQNRAKIGAVGVIALVLLGGVFAAKSSDD